MIGLKVNASFWIFQVSRQARSDIGKERSHIFDLVYSVVNFTMLFLN